MARMSLGANGKTSAQVRGSACLAQDWKAEVGGKLDLAGGELLSVRDA